MAAGAGEVEVFEAKVMVAGVAGADAAAYEGVVAGADGGADTGVGSRWVHGEGEG